MEYVIQGRSPRKLYDFFEQISAIPRGSRNEKEISEYLLAFAAERGLRVWRDEILRYWRCRHESKDYSCLHGMQAAQLQHC